MIRVISATHIIPRLLLSHADGDVQSIPATVPTVRPTRKPPTHSVNAFDQPPQDYLIMVNTLPVDV